MMLTKTNVRRQNIDIDNNKRAQEKGQENVEYAEKFSQRNAGIKF